MNIVLHFVGKKLSAYLCKTMWLLWCSVCLLIGQSQHTRCCSPSKVYGLGPFFNVKSMFFFYCCPPGKLRILTYTVVFYFKDLLKSLVVTTGMSIIIKHH